MIYLASDWHIDHFNIIKYSNRPFKDVHEMKDSCVAEVRSKLKDGDDLIYLGDFCFSKNPGVVHNHMVDILGGIKLRKFMFLRGNHDYCIDEVRKLAWDSKKYDITLLREIYEFKHNNNYFICCHYPLLSWNKCHHGSLMIHGHVHNNKIINDLNRNCRRIDVGYDYKQQWLTSADELVDQLVDKPITQHHE